MPQYPQFKVFFSVVSLGLGLLGNFAFQSAFPSEPFKFEKVAKPGLEVPQGIKFFPDITYGQPNKDRALQLDLAYPAAGKGPYPVVVFFHGTGILSRGRKFNLPQVFELAQKDFVAVTASYRHLPNEPFPGAIQDARGCIRWLRANAEKYQIDTDAIGAVGFSGGGSLALLLGLAPSSIKEFDADDFQGINSDVQAVVSYFAPTDLAEMVVYRPKGWISSFQANFIRTSLLTWLGGPLEMVPEKYKKASPTTYVRKGGPPILLLHGVEDVVVPVSQAELFDKKMKQAGSPINLITLKAPHDFDAIDDDITRMAKEKSHEFLSSHLRKSKKGKN